ncbi:hypothetical protein D9615_006625 [Tricholomella constricta]|uniref:C2H2-type domain-containing protein n=1 Tax=Tricholomella constricta TaxID=117010 RepID=A0A8H5H9Z1_9AGAR|nr:hypothetical protein D9615_006625 [Tricholomella constricta]
MPNAIPSSAPHIRCAHCPRKFRNQGGLTHHLNTHHRELTPPPNDEDHTEDHSFTYVRHPRSAARPCDENGDVLPPHAPPVPSTPTLDPENPWSPFEDRLSFDFASFHFVELQTSRAQVDTAIDLWAAAISKHGDSVPWNNTEQIYKTIDAIQQGTSPWKVYKIKCQGPRPVGTVPKWMDEEYELCTRDTRLLILGQLRTSDFKGNFHYGPYMQFNAQGDRIWSNLMSADWAWKQADEIFAEHGDDAVGAMFIPVIAGSDKTTVSVATGHQQYHPVYISSGGITNTARRAHGNAVTPAAFLPIPKTSKKQRKNPLYQKFVRQLYHACLARIFAPLKDGMSKPELVRCPDGHLRRAYFGLGPYIADYPEQVYLSGIVNNWCPKCEANPDFLDNPDALPRSHQRTRVLIQAFDPGILWRELGIRVDVVPFTVGFPRADIHELLSPDLLHQVIKGTFKDHLVTWVYQYLKLEYGEARALEITQDIDRRISAVPPFPGLRRFPDGRDFQQWTGDDSKALMKVFLTAIIGYVPSEMVQCISVFLDFCYLARRNSHSLATLQQLEQALDRFHHHRNIFIRSGVRVDISLPRQHSLMHYVPSIRLYGSPNGLCSSITESKHIKAVKEPWRRSNRYNALVQMLRTISRLEKLTAARREFTKWGMMVGSTSSYTMMVLEGGAPEPLEESDEEVDNEDEELGPVSGPKVLSSVKLARRAESGYPRYLQPLARHIDQPHFPEALRRFLWAQLHPDTNISADLVPLNECPPFHGRISVYHSAVAHFYAPSDVCGAGGMHRERIRSNPNWRGEYPRYDTVLVDTNADRPGMLGMTVGRVLLFFAFTFRDVYYPCALVHWLIPVGDGPDPESGLWVVKPEFDAARRRTLEVVHIDSVARAAHLLPIYNSALPEDFHFSLSLDVFRAFFVNRFADHHMHEFLT